MKPTILLVILLTSLSAHADVWVQNSAQAVTNKSLAQCNQRLTNKSWYQRRDELLNDCLIEKAIEVNQNLANLQHETYQYTFDKYVHHPELLNDLSLADDPLGDGFDPRVEVTKNYSNGKYAGHNYAETKLTLLGDIREKAAEYYQTKIRLAQLKKRFHEN